MIFNTSQSSSLETVQLDVAKWILHCNTKTNSSAVRAMLGLTPLEIRRAARRLTLFGRISFCRAVPSSVLLSRLPAREDWVEHQKSGGQAKDWYQSTEPWIAQFALREKYDELLLQQSDESEDRLLPSKVLLSWVKAVKETVVEYCKEEYERVCTVEPKLKLMKLTQKEPRLSAWAGGPLEGAKLIVARLRLGTNALREDLGRREGSKVCPCCTAGETEDAFHFLVGCVAYEEMRSRALAELEGTEWFTKRQGGQLADLPEGDQVRILLGGSDSDNFTPEAGRICQRFIREAWATRSAFLEEAGGSGDEGKEGG